MTKEELIKRCNKITITTEEEVRRLKNEFSINNAEYNIGDIIEDHYHIIKVESIHAWRFPEVVYKGTQLTKKLIPYKKQIDTKIYSTNIKRRIK